MKNFAIIVDGYTTTFYDFLADNSAQDVTPLIEGDIKSVRELQKGETVKIGMVDVSRPKRDYIRSLDSKLVPVFIPVK